MTLMITLRALAHVIGAEAESNPAFAIKLAEALQLTHASLQAVEPQSRYYAGITNLMNSFDSSEGKQRHRNKRRNPAVMDPVHAARDGADGLKKSLRELSLDQLHDIVAEFGMDTGKLVMKWKDRERVIDRIVEVSTARAHKGDVFRDQPAPGESADAKDKPIATNFPQATQEDGTGTPT